MDFNFGDFDMLISPAKINAELENLIGPAIQRIPVLVEPDIAGFEILNVCERLECVDEERSRFTKWSSEDGRPEKVGRLRMLSKLVVRRSAVLGHHMFRVLEWPIALVVSEVVKDLFEARNASGLGYERVD